MKERPILFSAPMVRALLNGTKTQTRRVVKPQPELREIAQVGHMLGFKKRGADGHWLWPNAKERILGECPYGAPGDRLWVRETFAHIYRDNAEPDERWDDDVAYKADHQGLDEYAYGSWKPSIHMPRWASRITLEITGVRVERLQDISPSDAQAEGIFFTDYGRKCGHRGKGWTDVGDCPAPVDHHPQRPGWAWQPTTSHEQCLCTPVNAFGNLWEHVNGQGSWYANPWVWVVEFRRLP